MRHRPPWAAAVESPLPPPVGRHLLESDRAAADHRRLPPLVAAARGRRRAGAAAAAAAAPPPAAEHGMTGPPPTLAQDGRAHERAHERARASWPPTPTAAVRSSARTWSLTGCMYFY